MKRHRTAPSRKPLLVMVAAALAVAGAVFGGVAAFAGPGDPTYTSSTDGFHACVARNGSSALYHNAIYRNASMKVCPAGYARFDWDSAAGPAGPPGKDATFSITATTSVSRWPENSGWAVDAFTRTLNLTRQSAAESSKCGGAPQCWFYTGTINDNGTFVTVAGKPYPNGTPGTIEFNVRGTMVGGAKVEFYASSDSPNAVNVPVNASGTSKPATTSDWYKLAFPAGTTVAGGKLTQYDWEYSTDCYHWSDKVNPGDDGQSAADGNIPGTQFETCPIG